MAADLLSEQPDLTFVHYHTYERTKIELYRRRYEDPSGVAEQVLKRLFDLHRATTDAVVLPIYSYSLKVVERYVGFLRPGLENVAAPGREATACAAGQWAMAKYIEATETGDPTARSEVLAQIKAYNNEDLNATWAVLAWLRDQSAA
jgi:predicted RecB family nuclease